MEIMVQVNIPRYIIEGLLVDAFSGAAQTWCCDVKVRRFPKGRSYDDYDYWTEGVVLDPRGGGVVVFTDPEGDPDPDSVGKDGYYTLTLGKIKRGLKKLARDSSLPKEKGGVNPIHWNNIMSDNCDWDTADVFLQYCVLGKLVYG
jgi:hypothetical protein